MRVLYTLCLLLTVTTNNILTAPTEEPLTLLTPELNIRMDNVAWLYAQFSLTFDGSELPLEQHFLENKDQFDMYKEVEDFFSTSNLLTLFPNVDPRELVILFQRRISHYQQEIMDKDEQPVSFLNFYVVFNNRHWLVNKRMVHTDLLDHSEFINEYCGALKLESDEQIIKGLNDFKIINPFKDKLEKTAHTLFHKYYLGELRAHAQELGLGDKEWTVHHIIPQNVLEQFYNNYFMLLEKESEKAQANHKYNWVKIKEFNIQKSLLVQANILWSFSSRGATLPAKDGAQQRFVRASYSWPKGLLMAGPSSSLRYDDPNPNGYGNSYYNEFNGGFEDRAKHIVGTRYFNIVKQLYTDIITFNNDISRKSDNDISRKSHVLRARLETVYQEYNNGKPIWIFPCDSKQWIKPTVIPNPLRKSKYKLNKNQVWGINTEFNADSYLYFPDLGKWVDMNDNSDDGPSIEMWKIKTEWREKALAQIEDNRQQMLHLNLDLPLPNFNVPAPSGIGFVNFNGVPDNPGPSYTRDELKRRKRYHIPDLSTYISDIGNKCKTLDTTTTKPVNIVVDSNLRDIKSCSYYLNTGTPSILAVPYWIGCKLFG